LGAPVETQPEKLLMQDWASSMHRAMKTGVVYVLTNAGLPLAVKIGQTTRDADTRAGELRLRWPDGLMIFTRLQQQESRGSCEIVPDRNRYSDDRGV
jgi:hypothetical protein